MRESVRDILVVKLGVMAHQSLVDHFDGVGHALIARAGLEKLRERYKRVSPGAIKKAAWNISESGSIGGLLRLGPCRSPHDELKQPAVAVYIERSKNDSAVVSCSTPEKCRGPGGCMFEKHIHFALAEIRAAMEVTMGEMFDVLSSPLRPSVRDPGSAVKYGKTLCVVRSGDSSWPVTVVRKSAAGRWLCVSCTAANVECTHRAAAERAVAAGDSHEVDESYDPSAPVDEDSEDEDGVGNVSGLDVPAVPGVAPAVALVNRRMLPSRSHQVRTLVPPDASQVMRQKVASLAARGGAPLQFSAPALCRFCPSGPMPHTRLKMNTCRIEFEEGAVDAVVWTWRCPKCRFRNMTDGKEEGIIFHSPNTAYCEAFLLELAVNISRHGSPLQSSAYLREGYHELSGVHKFLPAAQRLRSVTTLRSALLLYINLTIKGLPLEVTTCAQCCDDTGALSVICFDGLQLGYQLKHKKPFHGIYVRCSALPRASVYAHLVQDWALRKALGSVLNVSDAAAPTNSKTVSTLTAMRGYVMGVSVFAPAPGADRTLEDNTTASMTSVRAEKGEKRGWCPELDGGAHPAFLAFIRKIFLGENPARLLCLAVASGRADLRRRVPGNLMGAINSVLLSSSDDGEHDGEDERQGEDLVAGAAKHAVRGASVIRGAPMPAKETAVVGGGVGRVPEANSVGKDESSGEEPGVSETNSEASIDVSCSGDDDKGVAADRGMAEMEVDHSAPLASFAEALHEPALADTGGSKGTLGEAHMLLRLRAHIPTTAAATHKVIHFCRVLAVDPVMVWGSGDSWRAIESVRDVLEQPGLDISGLEEVLSMEEVCELRLLRGAVACLGPALLQNHRLRRTMSDLLQAVLDTRDTYVAMTEDLQADIGHELNGGDEGDGVNDAAVTGDEDIIADGSRNSVVYRAEEMACCHLRQVFTPKLYQDTWLRQPASPQRFRAAYGSAAEGVEDVFKAGVWAPSLPIVRPRPSFADGTIAAMDDPDCNHQMGREKAFTGGTFGAFCTCSHPKCVGVIILDGFESKRMPIEFALERCRRLPEKIFYDFYCASLKLALSRMPFVAMCVRFCVDRFHWRKNHVMCSKAMNPDSYTSLDGVNTSSSEERNSLARRQRQQVRMMTQDNFIIFTIYQQVLSNAIAMYRDNETEMTM